MNDYQCSLLMNVNNAKCKPCFLSRKVSWLLIRKCHNSLATLSTMKLSLGEENQADHKNKSTQSSSRRSIDVKGVIYWCLLSLILIRKCKTSLPCVDRNWI